MVRSFCSFQKPSANGPELLLVDGHFSHAKRLVVVDKAREHSVASVSILSHSTHKMQPLDIGIIKPLEIAILCTRN
jgi:hypothetical protein